MRFFTWFCFSANRPARRNAIANAVAAVSLALVVLAGVPGRSAAASLAVTPGSISNLYAGNITLQITGLTNSETVLVERFLDLNTNGIIDSGEPLVQSFRVTDGQVNSIGGVRNQNIPGDDDLTANGQVTATFNFAKGPEFSRSSTVQIIRVSSPGGHFTPVQNTLTVTQAAFAQQITGTISSGGTPLPFATAGVLVQSGNDHEYVAGTAADAVGHFSLAVSNGTYMVVAFAPGYVGSFMTSPLVTVAGANTNVAVPLTATSLTLSGSVTNAGGGPGVPAIQMFVSSGNNDYFSVFSDAQGNFSAGVINGQWSLDPSVNSLAWGGWLRDQNKVNVAVSGANVTGVMVPVIHGTALIYGTLKDDLNNPLAGVRVSAGDSANLLYSATLTDASGNYFLAVTNNTWYVGVESSGAGLPNGLVLQQVQVTLADGQAVLANLVAHHASAYLAGVAKDSNSNPLNGVTILAFAGNNQNVSAQTGADGSFALPVWGGTWTVSLETQSAASHGVVGPQLNFNVTDGVNISNINYVALIATRTISGSVKTSASVPITSLMLFAGAFLNGTNYNVGATTDGGGNYSMPVLPGIWNVGVDLQALAQRGYGVVFNQNADASLGNPTVNFIVGTPAVGALFFRHALGQVGEFGGSSTPTVRYPVWARNFRAIFHVFNDTNPPSSDTVFFTGPPGSGLTNTPADPGFGAVWDGTNVYYYSPPVNNPSTAMPGPWTVTYRTNANNIEVPDLLISSRLMVPLPTITVSNDLLVGISWNYKDPNGNPITGTPSFVLTNRIDLIDHNGNFVDAELFPAATTYTYPSTNRYHWSSLSVVRVDYFDDLTNQFFVAFSESRPSLTGVSRMTGQRYQFQLNAPVGLNYTVQYKTNLSAGNWNNLLILSNLLASPTPVVDAAATNGSRFYRVLVGP